MKWRFRWSTARRLAGALLLIATLGGLFAWYASQDVRYVVRAAWEEARILLARRPIARLAADSTLDPAVRAKLALVLFARDFARDSLGLSPGETYQTYADVHRDTLVLVLSASRYDRLAEYYWTYPVVGRMAYKGFFSLEQAQREARRLERIGMDTYIRPAGAFSTLGWFDDPLLSTVLRGDSASLVETVMHETLHATMYVEGQTPFNESFATFAGLRGAELFFRTRGDTANARRALARWRDELRLARFYADLSLRLEQLYAPGIAGPTLREERQRLFRLAQAQLAGPLARSLETVDGRAMAERPMNNAVVIANRLYRTNLETFDRLLAARRGDLRASLDAVRGAVAAGGDPWQAVSGITSGDGPRR